MSVFFKKFFSSILLLCVISFSYSKEFVSYGRGKSLEEARTSALREMSLTFSNQIQSSTQAKQSFASSNGKTTSMKEMDMRLLVTSDMQLYGVTFETSDNGKKGKEKEFSVKATLDSKNAIPLYEKELKELVKKIDARAAGIESLAASKAENEWQLLAADYASFDKLEVVLMALGTQNKTQPKLSSSEFRIKYERLAKEITSIEKAGEAIAKAILASSPKSNMYVTAAVFEGENTTTDFSVALANAVKSKLSKNLALTKLTSDSELKGSYYFAPGTVNG